MERQVHKISMEKHPLDDFIKEAEPTAKKGSHKERLEIWYNAQGDCIQFKMKQEAVVADRIDDYLTIYRSAISNEAIGFKLKDVQALIKRYGSDGMEIEALHSKEALISVTALLLYAFRDSALTFNRVEGYKEALNIPKPEDKIALVC